jgi:hypothetical protein
MNWVKGLDRIFFVFSILVFVVSAIMIFPETDYMPWWADPNPAYEVWYKEHGKKYEEHYKQKYGYINGKRFRLELAGDYPVGPPDKYLPIEWYKRIIATFVKSLGISLVFLFGFSAITRLIRMTIKWIASGFKAQT